MTLNAVSGNQAQPQTGIVALLDILGYKAFLENTEVSEAARIISEILVALPTEVVESLHQSVREVSIPELDLIREHEELISRMTRLVFADTVLLAQTLTPTTDPAIFLREIMPFLATASLLCRRFFDEGLPLRGAVALGEFVIQEHCFAGDAILRAHRKGHRLNFSGCGIEDETGRAFVGAIQHCSPYSEKRVAPPYRRLLYPAAAPCKSGDEQMLLLRWGDPFDEWGKLPEDLAQYVEELFQAHKKHVGPTVKVKMENTTRMLRNSLIGSLDSSLK